MDSEDEREPELAVVDFVPTASKKRKSVTEDEGSEESSSEEIKKEKLKKRRKQAKFSVPQGAEDPKPGFGAALETILGKEVTEGPILDGFKEVDDAKKQPKHKPKLKSKNMSKKKLLLNKDHVTLTRITENWQYEQSLKKKTATAGIVKLFNAVHQHQRNMDKEGAPVKETLSKEKFMELLKSTSQTQGPQHTRKAKKANKLEKEVEEDLTEEPQWSVLSDDFLLQKESGGAENSDSGEEPEMHDGGFDSGDMEKEKEIEMEDAFEVEGEFGY